MHFIYSSCNTNINSNKKSYTSLSYSETTSKSFLSLVSQKSTSCHVKSNKILYFLSYSKVFLKPIAADKKYSSFKTEDLLPLQDRVLSTGPLHNSYF